NFPKLYKKAAFNWYSLAPLGITTAEADARDAHPTNSALTTRPNMQQNVQVVFASLDPAVASADLVPHRAASSPRAAMRLPRPFFLLQLREARPSRNIHVCSQRASRVRKTRAQRASRGQDVRPVREHTCIFLDCRIIASWRRKNGRGNWIRTSDLFVPNEAR